MISDKEKAEAKAQRILIETGDTIGFDDDFGISDLQPVEETSSFSPNVVKIEDSQSEDTAIGTAATNKGSKSWCADRAFIITFVIDIPNVNIHCLSNHHC